MELEITLEELQKRRIFVATPMYGGQCTGMYTKSCTDLAKIAAMHGVDVQFYYLFNESLITRARNYLVDEFLRAKSKREVRNPDGSVTIKELPFTHLMFIDSDIGFNPDDVLALSAFSGGNTGREIICGPYPKKCISWEKIKMAVDKGFADKDPNKLENYVGDYVFNPIPDGDGTVRLDEPVKVLEGGTGFMMITREAIEKYIEEYKHLNYLPDHVRTKHFDGSREITAAFDALIDNKHANIQKEIKGFLEKNPKATPQEIIDFVDDTKGSAIGMKYSNRYLSEDYMFCQWANRIGIDIWLCPWMKMYHSGSYTFGGSLIDLAQIGASATADELVSKKKLT
jgi:hypothetical protein